MVIQGVMAASRNPMKNRRAMKPDHEWQAAYNMVSIDHSSEAPPRSLAGGIR